MVVADGARRFPDDLDLKALAGEVRLARGDETGASALFRGLIDSESGSGRIIHQLSEALMRQKR